MKLQLLTEHWVNGRSYPPGTVLDLPEPAARPLLANGVARDQQPQRHKDAEGPREDQSSKLKAQKPLRALCASVATPPTNQEPD